MSFILVFFIRKAQSKLYLNLLKASNSFKTKLFLLFLVRIYYICKLVLTKRKASQDLISL